MTDLPLSDALYSRLHDLLLARLGLYFPERRRGDLARGLSQVALAHGFSDLARLTAALQVDEQGVWDAVVSQLTIGETYFFRNDAQFAALRERILPELLSRRAVTRSLRLWSAGCATGEEPYSLAMTLADILPAEVGWQPSILGTDLNGQFLERAREAIYGAWSFRETPDTLRDRFFTPEGLRWRLNPVIRRMVLFSRLNLAEPGYPALANGTAAMDVIFCRNVLIYFDAATMRAVIDSLFAALAPGGWLVVGHAEPSVSLFQQFETINAPGTVLYRKPADAPLFSTPRMSTAVAQPPAHSRHATTLPSCAITQAPPPQHSGISSLAPPREAPPPSTAAKADALAAAWAAADRGAWERAWALAEQAAEDNPLCAAVHQLLGQIYEHAGELDAALAAYRRSLYLDPARIMAALGMANVWRQAGERVEARRGYRVALRLIARHPPDAPVADADGASAAELAAYARLQLNMTGEK